MEETPGVEIFGVTHTETLEDGYKVIVQYCDYPNCGKYLGVAYPRFYCRQHESEYRKNQR